MNKVEVKAEDVKVNQDEDDRNDPEKEDLPWTPEDCCARMLQVNQYVKDVSTHNRYFNHPACSTAPPFPPWGGKF